MDSPTVVTPPHVGRPLRLLPFHGLSLTPSRVGDPSSGRAFVRPYHDVAARLKRWQRDGHLERDPEPSLYVHEYTVGGLTVRGLVGLLDVSRRATGLTDRAVLPHEGIHPAQADDIADRMAEMRVNPAPILLVHRGTDELRAHLAEVIDAPPTRAFDDRAGHRHRIWSISDRDAVARVRADVAGTTALIADGHHRYAAYLRLQRRDAGGPADRGLAMLVDQEDTPLFLGAIHRVLGGTSFDDVADAARAVGATFTAAPQADAVGALAPTRLSVTDGDRWGVVGLDLARDEAAVEVLHRQLLPALAHGPRTVEYWHSVEAALAHTGPDVGVAVLMPAPDVDLVLRIAAADRLLPEKATSFQPKPSLGVLLRAWDDDAE